MIGVLTYRVKHRKTIDTLCLLKARGYQDIIVYAIPLQYQKKFSPIIEHRPTLIWDITTEEACKNFGYTYQEIEHYEDIRQENGNIMLVCGAGLLPADFISKYRVINAHPGYIPESRGLDALKWAIYEEKKIGATTHFIGKEVDAGDVILRREIFVKKNDTFHLLAQRVYENEIDMLVESIKVAETKETTYITGEDYVLHKRMPNEIESTLLDRFEDYKCKFAKDYDM